MFSIINRDLQQFDIDHEQGLAMQSHCLSALKIGSNPSFWISPWHSLDAIIINLALFMNNFWEAHSMSKKACSKFMTDRTGAAQGYFCSGPIIIIIHIIIICNHI